ncbi:TetR/AcrR family transcriptional regulator [Luedemannella flava]|uniref:TetR/AcrR family transcriptional regulator n=2 Tax=Luedemannella flava TaxID=349316 RepID=A0ABP4Y5Y9_9ACTN
MLAEIKAVARRHLATDGANLSLRAVARDMGMVSSALYRYYASRDELLTALIIDAYDALGEAVERADASVTDRADARGRWLACCHAVRDWALAEPAEYALIFGSPVPGYAAPVDTVRAAQRTPLVLIGIALDSGSTARVPFAGDVPAALAADFASLRARLGVEIPDHVLLGGSYAWIHLFGAVSFELFGQLNNVVNARREYFAHQMTAVGEQLLGL